MDSRSECSLTSENCARCTSFEQHLTTGAYLRIRYTVDQVVSIDILPDDVLLEIFDFSLDEKSSSRVTGLVASENEEDPDPFAKRNTEAWQPLVHVSQRWRSIIFGSPLRLGLQLVCTAKTPARDTLDVWPALPLCLRCDGKYVTESADNLIAVLERSDRVVEIGLSHVGLHLEMVLEAMQQQFPELTYLNLTGLTARSTGYGETVPVLPGSFLGGSAPSLKLLELNRIPFPGLPKLLLSTPHLVDLHLINVPFSGYISPITMLTALSTLSCLEHLCLQFESPRYLIWESQHLPRLTFVLPALTHFWFSGFSGYLEELVAGIDAPQLSCLYITFHELHVFDKPQFVQFISRTPRLKALENASVAFERFAFRLSLWQLTPPEQVCKSRWSLPLFAMSEDLYIYDTPFLHPDWLDITENTRWLELLHPFTGVKNLYLFKEFGPGIVPAVQELAAGSLTGVLPILQNIFLEGLEPSGPVQEAIGQLIAARPVTGHPIAVTRWDREVVEDDD